MVGNRLVRGALVRVVDSTNDLSLLFGVDVHLKRKKSKQAKTSDGVGLAKLYTSTRCVLLSGGYFFPPSLAPPWINQRPAHHSLT